MLILVVIGGMFLGFLGLGLHVALFGWESMMECVTTSPVGVPIDGFCMLGKSLTGLLPIAGTGVILGGLIWVCMQARKDGPAAAQARRKEPNDGPTL